MICENEPCPINQQGRCFTAMFLARQSYGVNMIAYWEEKAHEENQVRHSANMAPVTAEFLRSEYIKETRAVTSSSVERYCRAQDASLRIALTEFDRMVAQMQPE